VEEIAIILRKMKKYNLEITYKNGKIENLYINSKDIEKSMVQYQRNREPFDWRILYFQLILEKPPKPPKPPKPKKPKKPKS